MLRRSPVSLILIGLIIFLFFVLGAFAMLKSLDWQEGAFARLDNIFSNQKAVQIQPRLEKNVRLIEGWSSRDMDKYFQEQGLWSSGEFLSIVNSFQGEDGDDENQPASALINKDILKKFSFLPSDYSLEGYLYPDTYRIYASSSPDELIIKMLDNFDRHLTPEMRADIKKQNKTVAEIVIMASLLEKEAPIDYANNDNHDAKIIAGIFWDRIRAGQALQSCATLAYILGVNKVQYSAADTQVDSPYNTYKYRGLPPSPISNPGILAIEAAIYPISTNYNYFLTPAGSKNIIYASSYEQHLRNKNKYLP